MTLKRAVMSAALAFALGLEIISPAREGHPHVEKEIVAEPKAVGAEADALRPVVTPPENPWLIGYTLRVTSPEELKGWWANMIPSHTRGFVTVVRTQTCGEVVFNETAHLRNPSLPEGQQEFSTRVYLNEDYSVSTYTRKVAEQLQAWLLQRGVATQLLLQEVHGKGQAPDYRTPLSNFAPVYDDCDGVTELPTI